MITGISVSTVMRYAGSTNRTNQYAGDGTASLSDSVRALITDMKKRGYTPENSNLLKRV